MTEGTGQKTSYPAVEWEELVAEIQNRIGTGELGPDLYVLANRDLAERIWCDYQLKYGLPYYFRAHLIATVNQIILSRYYAWRAVNGVLLNLPERPRGYKNG